jgi:hypothetical protein
MKRNFAKIDFRPSLALFNVEQAHSHSILTMPWLLEVQVIMEACS